VGSASTSWSAGKQLPLKFVGLAGEIIGEKTQIETSKALKLVRRRGRGKSESFVTVEAC